MGMWHVAFDRKSCRHPVNLMVLLPVEQNLPWKVSGPLCNLKTLLIMVPRSGQNLCLDPYRSLSLADTLNRCLLLQRLAL